jgi:hypothetical protein
MAEEAGNTPMKVGEAIRHALDGNALLFVGSGFSRYALNVQNKQLPTGKHLAALLSAALGRDTDAALDIIADQYLERFGETSLIQLLREALIVKETVEAQRTTLSLPWRRIYTTNYDDVVERTSIEAGNTFEPLVARPEQLALPSISRACVHLNG